MISRRASQQAFLVIAVLPFAARAPMRVPETRWPGRVNRFRRNLGLEAICGLKALEFLERSSEIAAEPVIACETPAV